MRSSPPRVVLALTGAACLAGALAVASGTADAAPSSTVVISEVYGAGGNSGATLKNDFLELYNSSASPVNLAGWSVQYHSSSASSTTWQATALSGSIPAHTNYLVQEGAGGGGTQDLPSPDVTPHPLVINGSNAAIYAAFDLLITADGSCGGAT